MVALRAILWAVFGGLVGFGLGEFFPVFSGPLVKNLCEPFSPCRDSAAVGYVLGGIVLGFILGILNHLLVEQKKAKAGS
ncbi:MAG: hypothetical protein H6706_19625 [Myxococcales bacterium]|nr:hypothetical protein [Myxococcales bacterium]